MWVWPWLIGLALITKLGQFGGTNFLPFWIDLLVLAVFSLAIYFWAVSLGMSTEKVAAAVEEEELEAAAEPDLAVG